MQNFFDAQDALSSDGIDNYFADPEEMYEQRPGSPTLNHNFAFEDVQQESPLPSVKFTQGYYFPSILNYMSDDTTMPSSDNIPLSGSTMFPPNRNRDLQALQSRQPKNPQNSRSTTSKKMNELVREFVLFIKNDNNLKFVLPKVKKLLENEDSRSLTDASIRANIKSVVEILKLYQPKQKDLKQTLLNQMLKFYNPNPEETSDRDTLIIKSLISCFKEIKDWKKNNIKRIIRHYFRVLLKAPFFDVLLENYERLFQDETVQKMTEVEIKKYIKDNWRGKVEGKYKIESDGSIMKTLSGSEENVAIANLKKANKNTIMEYLESETYKKWTEKKGLSFLEQNRAIAKFIRSFFSGSKPSVKVKIFE